MKRTIALALLASMLSLAHAAPRIVGARQQISLPDPYAFGDFDAVAVDGDHMIVQASTEVGASLLAFDLGSDGYWRYVDSLAYTPSPQGHGLAMRNGVAVSDFNGLKIYERGASATGWVLANYTGASHRGAFAIDGDNILATTAGCGVATIRHLGTLNWTDTGSLPGASSPQCTERWYDADGNAALAANAASRNPVVDSLRLYQRNTSGSWVAGAALTPTAGVSLFDSDVVLRGSRAVGIAEVADGGDVVWGNTSGSWSVRGRLQSTDAFESMNAGVPRLVRISGDLFLQQGTVSSSAGSGESLGAIRVFREIDGAFVHVATLEAGSSYHGSGTVVVSGRHVIVTTDFSEDSGHTRVAYFFELPESLAVPAPAVFENFESGSVADWQTAGGSYSIARQGKTHVYRQSSISGPTGAVLTTVDQADQVIEAEITPTAFATSNRWAGVMTRQTDWQNYYYVQLRQPHAVEFKRVRNGVTTRLGYWTAAMRPVEVGSRYRVRLESIGNTHHVTVDGVFFGTVTDSQLPSGRPGIVMYQASADYDNVLVTERNPSLLRDSLFAHDPRDYDDSLWSQWGASNWKTGADNGAVTQTSLAGNARNLTGVATRDQRVVSQVRPIQFAPVTSSQDPWAGLIARYVDDGNFYYVSLRASNQVSLRKRVDGAIVGLDTVPLTITPNAVHNVRLEAIGDWLRVFVDGTLLIERRDTSHPSGTYGLATYKTSASFSNFVVDEP